MKTIEEMIKTFTPDEWDRIIKQEMEKIGLSFSEDPCEIYNYEPLFRNTEEDY